MSLKLYLHPLSSYCHKVLIALYENSTPFEPQIVNLGDAADRAAFLKLWPIGKFPLLQDSARNRLLPESSIIIEYLDQHYLGKTRFIPADPDRALEVREQDRFIDLYLHSSMQRIVDEILRPADKKDPYGADQARGRIELCLRMLDEKLAKRTWLAGEEFTLADCAAAPALFYSDMRVPMAPFKNVAAYFQRLKERPSYARVLKEAEPYFSMIPR